MNEWKASLGRVTLFPSNSPPIPLPSAHQLYRQVWGDEPDNFQKSANALVPSNAQGKRGGIIASCSVHPTRTDFAITAVPPGNAETILPSIGDASKLYGEIKRIVRVIGEGSVSASVSRVALNLQFQAQTASIVEANEALTRIIPKKYAIGITDEEDFILQVNQPFTSSSVTEVRMNRITKWSVDRIQLLKIPLTVGNVSVPLLAGGPSPQVQTVLFYAASLSLDINNVPSPSPIPAGQQSSLLIEAINSAEQSQRTLAPSVRVERT